MLWIETPPHQDQMLLEICLSEILKTVRSCAQWTQRWQVTTMISRCYTSGSFYQRGRIAVLKYITNIHFSFTSSDCFISEVMITLGLWYWCRFFHLHGGWRWMVGLGAVPAGKAWHPGNSPLFCQRIVSIWRIIEKRCQVWVVPLAS